MKNQKTKGGRRDTQNVQAAEHMAQETGQGENDGSEKASSMGQNIAER